MPNESKKPAVLQIIPYLEAGGAELSTIEIVDGLIAGGAQAFVVTQGGRMVGDVEKLGGETIIMPAASKNPLQIYRNKRQLVRLIYERGIDLVHARSRAPAWSGLRAAVETSIPFVTTYHGAYGEKEPFKRLYNSVMARGDRVIANSKFTADLVRKRYSVQDQRLRVIYRGVDIKQFSASALSARRIDQLRSQWGVERGRQIILHPARLTRLKGHGVVLEAMKELMQRGQLDEAVVIFAGDPKGRFDYANELRDKIKAFGLQKRVFLTGHCRDMVAAFSLADVTLIASTQPETFGRTSAEAQAMGCPVIATNIGAPPETVRATPNVQAHEITGWLVPPGQPAALADRLIEALSMSKEERQQLAQRAVSNVKRLFSDHSMKVQTLSVYDELLGSNLAGEFIDQSSRQ